MVAVAGGLTSSDGASGFSDNNGAAFVREIDIATPCCSSRVAMIDLYDAYTVHASPNQNFHCGGVGGGSGGCGSGSYCACGMLEIHSVSSSTFASATGGSSLSIATVPGAVIMAIMDYVAGSAPMVFTGVSSSTTLASNTDTGYVYTVAYATSNSSSVTISPGGGGLISGAAMEQFASGSPGSPCGTTYPCLFRPAYTPRVRTDPVLAALGLSV